MKGFLVSKLPPLACCAILIVLNSCKIVGINLKVILSIIEKSWIGSPIFFRGLNRVSKAKAISKGLVVKVNRDEKIKSKIILPIIFTAEKTPLS